MKKVMFVVVMLLVASTCFAQLQSPPSNVTGYVKVTCVASGFTPFGLPFQFWDVPGGGIPSYGIESNDPSDIVGDQSTCGAFQGVADLIWSQTTNDIAFRTCAGVWTGTLQTNHGMIPGYAFWYRNRTASNINLVLAGEVNNAGNYGATIMDEGGFTEYSWRDSRNVDRATLNLLTSGFLGGAVQGASDYVIEQTGASNLFWYRTGATPGWQGLLLTVDPGKAYWVFNRAHAGNDSWSYTYLPGGALAGYKDAPATKDNGSAISKINAPVTKVKTGAETLK